MKIKVERSKCISCGSCVAVCPQFFELEESGLAHLKNSKKDADENEELEVGKPGCVKDAAEVCPVQIIKISD
jgi:ferredoxin